MNQTGNGINPDNLQHFIDSAENAIALGQRQFFTPPPLAEAFMTPLSRLTPGAVLDPMLGSGHLLAAANHPLGFGIDVDARTGNLHTGRKVHAYQADVTRWFPLAHTARLTFDLILANPPFSLLWHLDRLAGLADSTAPGVREAYAAAKARGRTLDATLATLLIALDRLSPEGEGFLICNAATARRFLGSPEGHPAEGKDLSPEAIAELRRNLWCWLEVPGAVYENQQTPFDTAVLYFAASHGRANRDARLPLFLASPSADPGTVAKTLATALSARPFARLGGSIDMTWKRTDPEKLTATWNAVRHEYHQLYHGEKPAFNLRLDAEGRIRTHLDPFRRHAYTHNRDLLTALHNMEGAFPASLVVQQVTRAALRHAIHSGCWRVDPALTDAVARCVEEYEAVRAPFYTPNPIMALGSLDEESSIRCTRHGIEGISPGEVLPIRTWIENTEWKSERISLAGKAEELTLSGKELVVEVTAADGTRHCFHVRRDDATAEMDEAARKPAGHQSIAPIRHHHIQALVDHFHIPLPRDVAQLYPEAYQANLAALDELEALIERNLAAA